MGLQLAHLKSGNTFRSSGSSKHPRTRAGPGHRGVGWGRGAARLRRRPPRGVGPAALRLLLARRGAAGPPSSPTHRRGAEGQRADGRHKRDRHLSPAAAGRHGAVPAGKWSLRRPPPAGRGRGSRLHVPQCIARQNRMFSCPRVRRRRSGQCSLWAEAHPAAAGGEGGSEDYNSRRALRGGAGPRRAVCEGRAAVALWIAGAMGARPSSLSSRKR